MNHRLLHRWAREEALPLPSRTHPQTQKQTSAVYTEELTDLRKGSFEFFFCVAPPIHA